MALKFIKKVSKKIVIKKFFKIFFWRRGKFKNCLKYLGWLGRDYCLGSQINQLEISKRQIWGWKPEIFTILSDD